MTSAPSRVARSGGASSSFLGRDHELAELEGLLGRFRLITLTGAPGVGKTHLARELAERQSVDAVFVDLAPARDLTSALRTAAFALSAQEIPGHGLLEIVTSCLRRRQLLLLLDNCEHLLGPCRELAGSLLDKCPGQVMLVTSREALGLPAERAFALTPLAVPGRAQGTLPPEKLLRYPSVALFVDRAAAVEPRFILNAYVAPAVAEICRRLDGIPLAIEFAAALVDMLTPAEIAQRLDDRFDLLTEGGRGALGHHRTLEAALDWSHELLSEPERALLRRLSVFLGDFDIDAAGSVCEGEEVEADELSDLVGSLVSKSLVSKSLVAAEADGASGVRYRLLETVRAYASDRLEQAGEAAAMRERHARFYLRLAEALEPELTGPRQTRSLARLDHERDNLRRALEWSLGHARGEWALRLAGSLVLFWRVRCHFSEGRELLDAALVASETEAPLLRARALWGLGFLTMMEGDTHAAAPALEQSLEVFREVGDLRGAARALLILGNCNQDRPGTPVLPLLHESAALARTVDDGWCLAHALAIAGIENLYVPGDFAAARGLFEESLAVARGTDEKQGLRIALVGLGSVAHRQGDYRAAQCALEEALAITEELDEDYFRADSLQYLGWVALDQGDYRRARELVGDALALVPDLAPPGTAGRMLGLLARIDHAAGDPAGARRRFDEAGARHGLGTSILALFWIADLALEEGDRGEGRRLVDKALAAARRLGHKDLIAQGLRRLARLSDDSGDVQGAWALHEEALELQRQAGAEAGIVASLEALANLAAATGRPRVAAELLGAAKEHRGKRGYARLPWESTRCAATLEQVRRSLSREELEAALARGAALTLHEAAALAANRCGTGRSTRPSSGWASLTVSERHVAALVAEGLTNAQIAERLFIAVGTVKKHLAHIFPKLGVGRRAEIAREFWRGEQRTSAEDS